MDADLVLEEMSRRLTCFDVSSASIQAGAQGQWPDGCLDVAISGLVS